MTVLHILTHARKRNRYTDGTTQARTDEIELTSAISLSLPPSLSHLSFAIHVPGPAAAHARQKQNLTNIRPCTTGYQALRIHDASTVMDGSERATYACMNALGERCSPSIMLRSAERTREQRAQ